MDTETIITDSIIGQRLEKIKRHDNYALSYQGKSLPVTGTLTIGRTSTNDIKLDDKLVSREHALIQKIKEAYFVKDLGSTNGTYVNDEKIPFGKYIKLNRNDVLKVGRTEIEIM